MKRHVLLIGLPGAGKTVVGRRTARRLKAEFVDVDDLIEREQGQAVREIFAARGETAFRALEAEAVRRLLAGGAQVLSPGGGWAAQPGSLEGVHDSALTVWLEVQPTVALSRALRSGARPLLDGPDPLSRMEALERARKERYQRAEATVQTSDLTPDQVAEKVAELARRLAGW